MYKTDNKVYTVVNKQKKKILTFFNKSSVPKTNVFIEYDWKATKNLFITK